MSRTGLHVYGTLTVGACASAAFVLVAIGCTGGMPAAGDGGDSDPCPEGSMSAESTVSYAQDIRTMFSNKGCLTSGCHANPFPSSNYSLAEYATSFGPGDEAADLGVCNIVPGDADASYIIEKLRPGPRMGERMPLLRPALSDEEIGLIATWINDGAPNN